MLPSDGKYTYTYWNNGRINTVTWVTGTAPNTTTNTATYNINALGQRVRKVTPSNVVGTRRFMYDEAGRLAGEYDSAGKLVQETVWLGDTPIATLRPKSGSTTTPIAVDTFYVHADHLNTPRVITRPSDNKVVWKWENTEAFGNSAPNENPSALGAFTYNLRMPGQQFDKETGTFYNYFRDYDPSLGRYVQSDPIGLVAGMNTYLYVNANPVINTDPLGLAAELCYRPIQGYVIPGQHCFVRYSGGGSSSFSPKSVGPDPAPKGATCEPAKGPDDDACVQREMAKCTNYHFTKNNCCHCAEQALKACGQSITVNKWPNWPVNPGPQKGEPGYKP